MTGAEVGALALLGGLLALDRVAVGQFGVSQPVVTGPLVGWVLGDAGTGLFVGGLLQFLYAGALPIGASVPPDETTAALVGTAGAVVGARVAAGAVSEMATLPVGLLTGLAAGEAGRALDTWVRRANVWFAHRADGAAARGDDRSVERLALGGLVVWGVVGALAAAALAPAAALLAAMIVPALSAPRGAVLGVLLLAVAVVAFGSALAAMRVPRRAALFAVALAVGTLVVAVAEHVGRPW
jgi:mannose/fructose/N-acetylgalactosamine-specific phosphotransferase system component IIC